MAKDKSQPVADLVKERYKNAEVQKAILDEIDKAGTADKIISGELTLPSEYDAERHVAGVTQLEDALHKSMAGVAGAQPFDGGKYAEAQLKLRQLRGEA